MNLSCLGVQEGRMDTMKNVNITVGRSDFNFIRKDI